MGAKTRTFLDAPSRDERVRRLPCCICRRSIGHSYGSSEVHHWPTRGAGGTDEDGIPLCRTHHQEFHDMGQRSWQAKHGVTLADEKRRIQEIVDRG